MGQLYRPITLQPLHISIGDVPMSLRFFEEPLREKARLRYRDFSGAPGNGFQIALNDPCKAPRFPPVFEHRFEQARLRMRQSEVEFCDVRQEYALDSLIRILLTVALVPREGFLLHAASVVRDGRAYVFMGRSGAGKSTVASLSPEGSVLTDEISLLRRENNLWRAHGTPFWGEFRAGGNNRNYPVAGIYCLEQARSNRLEPIRPKELLRSMLPCVLFFTPDPRTNRALLNILMSFVQNTPCFRLHFRKDSSFWGVIAQ